MYKSKSNVLLLNPNKELEGEIQAILDKRIDKSKLFIGNTLDKQMLKEENIKLILINMLKINELEMVLIELKSFIEKGIQIIGIFDEDLRKHAALFSGLGMSDWIIKPYLKEELENRVGHSIAYVEMLSRCKNNKVLFDALLHNVPYMSWFKNKESQYMKVNKKLSEHAGKDFNTITGRDDLFVWDGKIGSQCRQYDLKVMNERRHVIFNEFIEGKNGKLLFEVHKAPVIDENDEVIGTVGVARDITEQKVAQEKIEKMAYTDDLTQVNNRRGFYQYMEQLKINGKEQISMFYMDLDNFKMINDRYGHYYGDKILVQFTNILRKICHEGVISRLGGDEFVVVFEHSLTKQQLISKVEDLIECTQMTCIEGIKQHLVSTSIGVVHENLLQNTVEGLLTKGDMALYKAKENGKSQYVVYTSELEKTYQFKIEIEAALEKALLAEEFIIHYQPQYRTDKKIVGFEALLRWKSEKYKQVPISEVINIIESKGLIYEVGDYIFKTSCEFAKDINRNNKDRLIVSINISALQLMEQNFVDKIKTIIGEVGVLPQFIGLEITETILLEDIDKNIEKLRYLKEMGITILLDDFGTGYSSLNYISKLPLSGIKIDQSFIKMIHQSNTYRCMTQTIIQMAHLIELEVIAEGIETEIQLQILKDIGVDYMQGYWLGRPMGERESKMRL